MSWRSVVASFVWGGEVEAAFAGIDFSDMSPDEMLYSPSDLGKHGEPRFT